MDLIDAIFYKGLSGNNSGGGGGGSASDILTTSATGVVCDVATASGTATIPFVLIQTSATGYLV